MRHSYYISPQPECLLFPALQIGFAEGRPRCRPLPDAFDRKAPTRRPPAGNFAGNSSFPRLPFASIHGRLAGALSPARECRRPGLPRRGLAIGHRQAGHKPLVSALVRHAPARGRLRSTYGPGAVGTFGRKHNNGGSTDKGTSYFLSTKSTMSPYPARPYPARFGWLSVFTRPEAVQIVFDCWRFRLRITLGVSCVLLSGLIRFILLPGPCLARPFPAHWDRIKPGGKSKAKYCYLAWKTI